MNNEDMLIDIQYAEEVYGDLDSGLDVAIASTLSPEDKLIHLERHARFAQEYTDVIERLVKHQRRVVRENRKDGIVGFAGG